MDRAEYLFNKLNERGEDAIDEFIDNYTYENLFLDFKNVATKGTDKKIHQNDRKNYAKAISGFGNSEGGILIWGVECKDIPTEKRPIDQPNKFASYLESITSNSTMPPHNDVINKVFLSKSDEEKGYVVSYIPQSTNLPHLVLIEKNYYYVRVGSSFEQAAHGVLAGMFGRQPQPKVSLNYSYDCFLDNNPKEFILKFKVTLINIGRTLAKLLYFSLILEEKPGGVSIEYKPTENSNLIQSYSGRSQGYISRNDFYLPPGVALHFIDFEMRFSQSVDNNFKISGMVGCENAPSTPFIMSNYFRFI